MRTRGHHRVRICLVANTAAFACLICAQGPDLPRHTPTRPVAGTIHICGSPQMGDLLKLYEQGFTHLQPAVHFEQDLTSTVSAVAGVSSGRAQIGLLGREIWPSEEQAFVSAKGYAPTVVDVATGSFNVPKATFALMIFVPSRNPIRSVSMGQLEQIFASSGTPILNWGQLGLKGGWASRSVHLYGFNAENDKAQIFRQMVFRRQQPWSTALKAFSNLNGLDAGELIVRAVAADPDGIGISNVAYATPAVRALPISVREGDAPVSPTRKTVASRGYPLTRAVYMVVDRDPDPATVEFLRYVLSRQGRQAVVQEGNYLPLPPGIAKRELRELAAP